MLRPFAIVGLALMAVTAAAEAQPAARVEWEIAHRFRLFRDEGLFREILKIYRSLDVDAKRAEPAMALELALEKAAAERRLPGALFGEPWDTQRFGWSHAVRSQTCFQPGNRSHYLCRLHSVDAQGVVTRNGAGERFMEPRLAAILARLTNVGPDIAMRDCVWTAGSVQARAPCGGEARLSGVPYDSDFTIAVTLSDGREIARTEAGQRARHVFIAGLGDSFASGEGNPDRPALLSADAADEYQRSSPLGGSRYRYFPLRRGNAVNQFGGPNQPLWLSEQCHRSLHSQQLRTALAIALEQPDVAVTFTGYACTGASTDEGILGYWVARAEGASAFRDDSPQIMRLMRDYCRNPAAYNDFARPQHYDADKLPRCRDWRTKVPDVVLLSIGGNDIGFSRVIANQVVGTDLIGEPFLWQQAVRLWLGQLSPMTFAEAQSELDRQFSGGAQDNLARIRKSLDSLLRSTPDAPPRWTVIQSGYPLMTTTRTGTCRASDDGMDVHAAFFMKDGTGLEGERFVNRINAKLRSSAQALEAPWTFVDDHAARFAGHAICQPGAPPQQDFTSIDYSPQVSGAVGFPLLTFNPRTWRIFRPDEWRAYRPRQRWFVTPNDAFLTGHFLTTKWAASDKTQPLMAASLSGAFHPNALGHAAIADSVLVELRRVLNLRAP